MELVLIHHPDKNNGMKSEKFLEIQEAYLILSNAKSRLRYDMFLNLDNPNFDPAKAHKIFREKFMTK